MKSFQTTKTTKSLQRSSASKAWLHDGSADSHVREVSASVAIRADKAVSAALSVVFQSAPSGDSVGLALLCASTTLPAGQASEPRYRVVKIIEGSGRTVPEAGGINQKGRVVGSIDTFGYPRFWLWSDGVRQDLDLGNGRSGHAAALNNLGQVVGDFFTGEFVRDVWGDVHEVYHAFVWNAGSIQDLGTLGGLDSSSSWINDQGVQ